MINIQQLINESVERSSQINYVKRDGSKFHVSDAGTCYRKRYLKRLGVEGETAIATASLLKMAAGDAAHIHLQKLLHSGRKLFGSEGVVETAHIKGHYDGIIKDGEAKLVVDFKSVEKWGMSHIKGSCRCADKDTPGHVGPKKEHELQLFTYWGFLRQDFTNLDQATLLYVKREDFGTCQFNYLWSEEIAQRVANEWTPLLGYWERQEVPPCTCHLDYGGNGVKYCRYANEDQTECCSLELLKTVKKKEEVSV